MNAGGWITMLVSLAVVWGGCIWCFAKVLKSPAVEEVPPGFGP